VESKGNPNNEDILKMQSLQQSIAHVRDHCSSTVHAEDMYHLFADMGLEYGGAFKGLSTVCWDKGCSAAAHIQSSPSADDTKRDAFVDYIVNPAVLDALAQLAIVPLTRGGSKVSPTCLPTRFRGLWVSARGLNGNSADGLTSSMTSFWKGSTGTDATGIAQDQNGDIVFSIEHLEATLVSNSASEKGDDGPRRLCYEPHLRPDIDMLDKHQLQHLVQPEPLEDSRTIDFNIRVRHAMKWFISTMLAQITEEDVKNAKPHIQRYITWLTRTRISTTHEECWNIEDDAFISAQLQDAVERENFFTTLQHDNPIGELYMSVGRNILPIIRGDSNILELLFNSRLADDYYIESMKAHERSLPQILGSYIDLLAHKNPNLAVLEIGAGTGAVTNPALSASQSNAGHQGIPRYSVYDFTDISPAFFERAKARLPAELQSNRIRFRTLDIEQNPSDQGFEDASYDLIIAGYVLHATKDLKATLRNVRQLLKPGGRLVLCELIKNDPLGAPFAFGLLPGWWLATDARDSGACVDEDAWARLLSDTGFSGADAVVKDTDKPWLHQSSVIFATAVEESRQDSPTKPDPCIAVVGDPKSTVQVNVARSVGVGLSVISLEDFGYIDKQRSTLTIFLFELEHPLLAGMDELQFEQLKMALLSSKQILWIMRGATDEASMPYYGMILGFARAFRQENPHIPFTTLSVDASASAHQISSAIHRISDTSTPDSDTELRETDYILKDTVLHVQRILEVESLDNHINRKTSPQERHLPLSAAGPISLTIGTPGLLDTLHCIPDPVYATPLQPGEIDVEVKAAGLNFRDVMAALGKIGTDELGCECAGIVHRVGPNSPFSIGDRVMAIKFGWFRTYARCEERFIVRLGDECSFEDAAALPITALTAYYAIVQMGRLEKSESVLIHAGAGATGQMCVQLAQLVGSQRVFVTVGSDAKRKFVMEEYGISSEHIFNSRDTSFAQGILRATGGVGVDMVVNSLSGEGLTASLEVMAPFGRFVELGKADIRGQAKMSMEVFSKGMSFIPVAIDYLSEKRPALVREMLLEVMAMVNDGRLHAARPVKAYPLSQAEAAVRYLQSGTSIGKVVLTMSPEDVVPVSVRTDTVALASCSYNNRSVVLKGLPIASRQMRHMSLLEGWVVSVAVPLDGSRPEGRVI
jgi:NADPH:quinone reductase-like Zn-dependent oxidoreductase/SAM-dependent methyltransferase